MKILAFDPGHQTGVAFLDDGQWHFGMTIAKEAMDVGILNHIYEMCNPDMVVVESPPTRMVDPIASAITALIIEWHDEQGIQVEKVNPGQWKGMTASQNFKISGQHQNDAALMAYWANRHEAAKLVNIFGGRND